MFENKDNQKQSHILYRYNPDNNQIIDDEI